MKRRPVDAYEFARIWSRSSSVEEVMRKTGLKAGAIRTRVSRLRKRITLKRMPRVSRRLDYARLRKIARSA